MDVLQSNALGFPSPQAINEYFRRLEPSEATQLGPQLLPETGYPTETPQWDVLSPIIGETNDYELGTDPKRVAFRILKTKLERTAYNKDEMNFTEKEFVRVREWGTIDKKAGGRLITDGLGQLNGRLNAKVERQRWGCLQGTLTINDGSGVIRTIDYELPAANKARCAVTAGYGAIWTDTTNADPIADFQKATEAFRGKSSGRPTAYMNAITIKLLSKNAKVRDLIKQSVLAEKLGRDNIGEAVVNLTGRMERIVTYDEGSLTGDPNASLANFSPYIPDNVVIIIAPPPQGQRLGAYYTTPSVHNGGPMNPQPGRFAFPVDRTDRGNPTYDLISGVYGIPALFFPECVFVLTVV